MVKLFLPVKCSLKELIYFQSISIIIIIFTKNKYNNTIVSLRTIINGNVSIICYDPKDTVPICVWSISHIDYNTLSPLHIPIEAHDNITDANIGRKRI